MSRDLWPVVKAMRARVLADIDRAVDEAMGELERHEAVKLGEPKRGGGEWDWYWALGRAERARLRRSWMSEYGSGPDVVADRMGTDVDTAMGEWVRWTRLVDARASMAVRKSGGGYVPGTAAVGGCDIDALFPDLAVRLVELFSAQPHCTRYLGEMDDEYEWTADDTAAFMNAALGGGDA